MPGRPDLTVLRGGRHAPFRINGIDMIPADQADPPFPVDARAFEEDTYLVLSADQSFRDSGESLGQALLRANNTEPHRPGTVVVQSGKPLRLLAVIHDLDEDPTWKKEWIRQCLSRILTVTEERRLPTLGLPLLGTKHGRFNPLNCLNLTMEVLGQAKPTQLKRLWLVVPKIVRPDILARLRIMAGADNKTTVP